MKKFQGMPNIRKAGNERHFEETKQLFERTKEQFETNEKQIENSEKYFTLPKSNLKSKLKI